MRRQRHRRTNWAVATSMAGLLAFGPGDALGASQGLVDGRQGGALLAEPVTSTFQYTGSSQSFTVPQNTCSVTVDAYGAEGGRGQNSDERRADGGKGGRASAAIDVEPGDVLLVFVGGRGVGVQGGYNGGADGGDASEDDAGGGGGASDVRRVPFDLPDRLIVAGGGGGGGADADGGTSTTANGGAGGGLQGGDGHGSSSGPPTSPGLGGTQTAGGARGSGDSTARSGALGEGGLGGDGASGDDTGGGGGGGWYGGGGGAGEDDDQGTDGGAGGGGGSGYGPSGVTFGTGVRSGHGLVDITWQVGNCDVSFDWTMPDRFGFDKNGDGLMDYYPPTGSLEVEPDDWRVDFKDTSKTTCDQSLWRKWFVNGVEVLMGAPEVIFYSRASCDFAYKFPDEARYNVKLEIKDGSGNLVGSHTEDVTVQDWLIVAIGDSIASGEGVPEMTAQQAGNAGWQSRRCHRSALAGVAWAARHMEQADPRTSVTFIHLACSGAKVTDGLLGGYEGIEPGGGESAPPSQVEQIRQLAPDREVDAVLMSVGANDVLFGYIARFCAIWHDCHLYEGHFAFSLASQFLPGRYQELGAKLAGSSGVAGLPSRRIYLTEYADPTRYDDASICGSLLPVTDDPQPGELSDEVLHDWPGSPVFGISEAEAEWASNVMVAQLNQMGQIAANANGWSYIGGMMVPSRHHGYCANDTWIVPYQASMSDQGDKDGTLHPNVLGHLSYAGLISERLKLDFYAGGNLEVPRRPGT